MAIGIVVAKLGRPELVAGPQHRHAARQHQRGDHGPRASRSMHEHRGIGRRPLHTAVVAMVVMRAVAIVFAVGKVLSMPVRHQVGKRHAVMCGDEIDARRRIATAVPKKIARAGQPRGQRACPVRVASPETTLIVAKAIIPFGPAGRKTADEMPFTVPGLSDQLAP